MECPSCGSENPESVPACPSCGASLEAAAAGPAAEAQTGTPAAPTGQPITDNAPSPGPPDQSPQRPGCITAYVVLMGLALIVGLFAVILDWSLSLGLPLSLDPLGIAQSIASAIILVGLWRMRNWARIGMILIESFVLLRTAATTIIEGFVEPGWYGPASVLFTTGLSLYLIYWFATHAHLFDRSH